MSAFQDSRICSHSTSVRRSGLFANLDRTNKGCDGKDWGKEQHQEQASAFGSYGMSVAHFLKHHQHCNLSASQLFIDG